MMMRARSFRITVVIFLSIAAAVACSSADPKQAVRQGDPQAPAGYQPEHSGGDQEPLNPRTGSSGPDREIPIMPPVTDMTDMDCETLLRREPFFTGRLQERFAGRIQECKDRFAKAPSELKEANEMP
jgi:hypothetical protein